MKFSLSAIILLSMLLAACGGGSGFGAIFSSKSSSSLRPVSSASSSVLSSAVASSSNSSSAIANSSTSSASNSSSQSRSAATSSTESSQQDVSSSESSASSEMISLSSASSITDNDIDTDDDGFSDKIELEYGTDPNDANDYPDTVLPLLQVINQINERIGNSSVILRGTVSDPVQPYSGVQNVMVTSDRFSNISLIAQITGDEFVVEVPLALGENLLNIRARDISGNTAQATHQVQRIALPHFQNIVPASGTILNKELVTIEGEIKTTMPLEALRFYINTWQVTLNNTHTSDVYGFNLSNIPLQLGLNTFYLRVETIDGDLEQPLILTYLPENPSIINAPEIVLISPADRSQLQLPGFLLKGRVTSYAGAAVVTVNGQLATVSSANGGDSYFESALSFSKGQEVLDVLIEATDVLNKKAQLNAVFYLDSSVPQIYLNGLLAAPAINSLMSSPSIITGSVIDTNLASVTINDQPMPLQPGAIAGWYDFSIPLSIAPGEQVQWVINAYDLSGNKTSVIYIFQSAAQATISPLLPSDNAEFLYKGQPLVVQVAARVSNLPEGSRVVASLGAVQVNLARAGTLASGDISLPSQPGNYVLNYQVLDSSQTVLASTSRNLRVIDEAAIALEILSHQPENNALNIEPNQPIELYFNKAIDTSKLSVSVRETLHGNTYLDMDQPGLDFLSAKGYQLQEVHRESQLIPGSYSVLPGNQTIAFYTTRQFGFNGDIRVDVSYAEEELARFNFKVRSLPTFVIGGVADQFGQPLAGVKVSLPELDRTTITNKDGSFAFGFQEQPGNEIPGGRHKIIINPDFSLPYYGVQVRTITLQEGRKNAVGLLRLAELHRDIPFQLTSSGQADSSFVGGDLRLDFSDARLLFNNGRLSGNVQFQFMPFEQLNTAFTPGFWPQWMFAGQPRGVTVENTVGIDIKMPALNGGYDYIPEGTDYIVLLGYNPEREVIEPVGIGKIENYRVVSLGKVNINALDYLGYALLDPTHQPLLQQVAEGTQSMQQLISKLQQKEQE